MTSVREYPKETYDTFDLSVLSLLMRRKCVIDLFSIRFKTALLRENNLHFDPDVILGEDTLFVFGYVVHCRNVAFVPGATHLYYKYKSHPTGSTYFREWPYLLQDIYRRIRGILHSRFPGDEWTEDFLRFTWGAFNTAIFSIIRERDWSFFTRVKELRRLLKTPDMQPYLARIEEFMPQDSPLVRRLIGGRHAFLTVLLMDLSDRKSRLLSPRSPAPAP